MKLDKYTVGKRYARALFELADENKKLPETFSEIKDLEALFQMNPDLGNILTDARLSLPQKQPILAIVQKSFSPFIQQALQMVFDYKRMDDMPFIIDEFIKLYDAHNQTVVASVTSVVPLTGEQQVKLGETFAKRLDMKKTIIDNKVDPNILGGVIIEANGQVFDGSLKTKIAKIKQAILNK